MTARRGLGLATGRPLGAVLAMMAALWLAACGGMPPPRAAASDDSASGVPADPSDADRRARARLELASAYFANGKFDTALAELRRSIAANPNLAEAYNLRALIHAALGDDQLADESFRRALQINPRDGAVLHNQGWFYCQRDRFAEAQERFSAALALPQYRDAARTQLARGVCYARNREWPEAEAALMRAYELDPANPGVGFNLAEVLYRRQDLARARFYVGRVNDTPGAANAQSLWLAARIEHALGRGSGVRLFGEQLRSRFPQSPEAALYDRERFDD